VKSFLTPIFQPVLSSSDGHPLFYLECLARVRNDESRQKHIPIFENADAELLYLIDSVMLDYAAFSSDLMGVRIGVNVSRETLGHDFGRYLRQLSLVPHDVRRRLIVEIVEDDYTKGPGYSEMARMVGMLSQTGCTVALDDIDPENVSSCDERLAMHAAVSFIKLSMPVTRRITSGDIALLCEACRIGSWKPVVGEGVGNRDIYISAVNLFDYLQGFFLSIPVNMPEAMRNLNFRLNA